MSEHPDAINRLRARVARWHFRIRYHLETLGFLPLTPEIASHIEDTVQESLSRVPAPADFRERLRHNLDFAAANQASGHSIVVDMPPPRTNHLILGLSAGLLAATIATTLIIVRSRLVGARR